MGLKKNVINYFIYSYFIPNYTKHSHSFQKIPCPSLNTGPIFESSLTQFEASSKPGFRKPVCALILTGERSDLVWWRQTGQDWANTFKTPHNMDQTKHILQYFDFQSQPSVTLLA